MEPRVDGPTPLTHSDLREVYADSLKQWASKIEAANPRGPYMTLNWHGPPSHVILDAHQHGLLDHEPLICERINAKLATMRSGARRDYIAQTVFRDLRQLFFNPGHVMPADVTPDKASLYKRDADTFRRIAAMLKTGNGANDGRDAWMYQQKKSGRSHKQIRLELAKKPEWDQLDTDQSIGQAIDRYTTRRGLPPLRVKAPPK